MTRLLLTYISICWLITHSMGQESATQVRAVWLTTNYRLDFPHPKHTTAEEQKQELRQVIARLDSLHFNTILFQVRFRGEVAYSSNIEPFSNYFGKLSADGTLFDPLAYAIEECHKRGIECHAWITTYPIGHKKSTSRQKLNNLKKKNPQMLKLYNNEWFLDPGHPATTPYLLSIIEEITCNYDIDGIHLDYIRYPDINTHFPDHHLFRKLGKGQTLAEWRRGNITQFVSETYQMVKRHKPWVQVSSAPLGIYRSLDGKGNRWTGYESVYQDAALWLQLGIHDALFPMMYYPNETFFIYSAEWLKYANGRIIAPGLGVYKLLPSEQNLPLEEITKQMDFLRDSRVSGEAFFRNTMVLENLKGIKDELISYYRHPAKLPPLTWLSNDYPQAPTLIEISHTADNAIKITWEPPSAPSSTRIGYNIYSFYPTDPLNFDNPENIIATNIPLTEYIFRPNQEDEGKIYAITTTNRYHLESTPCEPAMFIHSSKWKK